MSSPDEPNDPYGAIKFGEFRKYMQNKQSKLKRQQRELGGQASQELPQIFAGTSIYINGYSHPPASDLRRMILQHGGDYQHYLKKSSVTHIVATNLTNSKLQEFRAYKVVRPEWITESVQGQQMLPWQNYRLVPRATTQRELLFSNDTEAATAEKITGKTLNANVLSNEWARQISTVNPTFIKRYYETSRLHYLSTWKEELKDIVEKLGQNYKSGPNTPSKKRSSAAHNRTVMHVDFDCFFASVGIKDRPHLSNLPVAVSHSKAVSETSSSDIASCNYVARSFGVRNGMTMGMAKGLCPTLQVIPYEFDKYKAISKIFYEILFQHADEMQAVSVDEALLEVGSHITQPEDDACGQKEQQEALATAIRDKIRQATGCEASVGIGPNILLARMSTKRAKPAGQYVCKSKQDIDNLLASQDVTDFPGVGYAISDKLKDLNVTVVSDLRKIPLHELQTKLGAKMGQTLYNFSRGIDDRPLITHQQRQSVSAEVNWGVRFENEQNEREFVDGLAKEVAERLQKHNVKGRNITVKILKRKEDANEAQKHLGHGKVDAFTKSYTLGNFTDDPAVINKHVYSILKSFQFSSADIRGLGIHVSKLNNQEKLSPDQGTLNFESHIAMNEQRGMETGESSRQAPKETIEVDPLVYNELPDSVKKELEATCNLLFKEPLTTSGEIKEIPEHLAIASLPELPPWSQLDPLSLLALPDEMREQILKTYAAKVGDALLKSPVDTPTIQKSRASASLHTKTPRTSKSKVRNIGSGSNRSRTITQMFQHPTSPSSRSNISSPSINSNNETPTMRSSRFQSVFQGQEEDSDDGDLPYDADVWKELPQNMKDELLEEHRRLKRLKVEQKQLKEHPVSRQGVQRIDLRPYRTKEPSLQGVTDVNEIRSLLREWVASYKEGPEAEDVVTITNYLIELVHYADLEKVHLVIIYLTYLVRDVDSLSWKQCTKQLQEAVSNTIKSVYGCPLCT